MSAFDPIDLEALLAPLPNGIDGAGTDLRQDFSISSHYQRLRDARAAARAEERTRDVEADSEGAESKSWQDVILIGQEALQSHSKDIEVAAWVTEGLVRLQGLSGLADGARLIEGLCNGFWEAGFPQPDEDGMEVRSSPIGGLSGVKGDGTVMQPLRRLPLFRRVDGSGVSLYQWEQAEQLATLDAKRRADKVAKGAVTLEVLSNEARLNREVVRESARQLRAAKEAWRSLDAALEQHLGRDAPSLRSLLQTLDLCLEVVVRLGGGPSPEELADTAAEAAADDGAGPTGTALVRSTAVMSRETALQDLERVAEFFRRTEPQSPLAYTLDEAVRRGRMTLAELLEEVLPNADVRRDVLQRLGIKPGT